MTARYSIMVREYGSDHDVELMQVNSNPAAICEGLKKKTLKLSRSVFEPGKRTVKIPKYSSITIIDHEKGGQP